jgi:hypothetical protein
MQTYGTAGGKFIGMIFETAWSMIKYDEIHQHMMGHH